MPRCSRLSRAGYVYHVLNRSAKCTQLFETADDYRAFEAILVEARLKFGVRIIAYCAMPTHWHLLLWPIRDGDLSRYVKWLGTTHAARWRTAHNSVGFGAVYQGRFKSIPIETGYHLYWVWRYVERNPLRANLVARAEQWRWSSLWWRLHDPVNAPFDGGPVPLPPDWTDLVNLAQTPIEVEAFRRVVTAGQPFGSARWSKSNFDSTNAPGTTTYEKRKNGVRPLPASPFDRP